MRGCPDTAIGRRFWPVMLLLLAVLEPGTSSGSEPSAILLDGFEVANLPSDGPETLSETRVVNVREVSRQDVGQGVDEIRLAFDLQNGDREARDVSVFTTTSDPSARLVDTVTFLATVPGFATLQPAGTFRLRQDRSTTLDTSALSFLVLGEPQIPAQASEALGSGRGGSLNLVSREGAVVTFEVPPDGLPNGGSVITMVETGTLPGLPPDFDPVVAVRLAPGGQTFTRSNRVIVEVPAGTRDPGEILVAFLAEDDGSALRFLPLVNGDPIHAMGAGQRLEFEVPHFSTTGIGKSRTACANLPPPGSSAEDRNAHRIQQAACAAATEQFNGNDNAEIDPDVVSSALADWLENPLDGVRTRIEDAIDRDPALDLDSGLTLAREALRLAAIAQLYGNTDAYFDEVGDLILRLLADIRAGILSDCDDTGFTSDKIGDLARIAASIQVLTASDVTDLSDFTCPDALAVAPVAAPVVTLGDTVAFEVLTSEDVVASLVADDLVKETIVDARNLVGSSPGLTNIRGTADGRILAEASRIGLVPLEVTINVPVQGGGLVPRKTTGEVRVLPDFEGEYTVTTEGEQFAGRCGPPFDYVDRIGSSLTLRELEFVPESDFNFITGETVYGALGTATLEGVDWPLTVGISVIESARDDRPPGAEGALPEVFLDGAVGGMGLVLGSGPALNGNGNVVQIVEGLDPDRSRTPSGCKTPLGDIFNRFGFRASIGFGAGTGALQSDASNITARLTYRYRGRELRSLSGGGCETVMSCEVEGTMILTRPANPPP